MITADGDGVLAAFATMASALERDYDEVALLQALVDACKESLDVDAAGAMVADQDSGALVLVASTDDRLRIVERVDLAAGSGPAVEAYRSARVVPVPDIARLPSRQSGFRDSALAVGLRSVYAVPMRLRSRTVGSLSLFRDRVGEPSGADRRAARALVVMATLGIAHERDARVADLLRSDLDDAVASRVAVEQAKGVLAQAHGETVDQALVRLRDYARAHGTEIAVVAARVVDRSLIL